MKKLFTVILFCAAFTAIAQEASAPADQGLFSFDLKLAPNTTGALEGTAEVGVLWSPWVYSSAAFSVTSFTAVYDENGGSTTSVESIKNLDLAVLRTRRDFLKWNFAGDDFYAALNGRVLLNLKLINQEKYGYVTGPAATFFTKEDIFNIYPFAGGDLEVKLGPVQVTGYFMQSLMILYTTREGEFFDSTGMTDPQEFSLEDKGFEMRTGGTAIISPIPAMEIKYSFDFTRHIGYTFGYLGGGATSFVYTGIEMKHSLTISLDIGGYKPMVGASYTTYSFDPLKSIYSTAGYDNVRWGFIFGVKYM